MTRYRSKFESAFHKESPQLEFEQHSFKYTVPASQHTYTPDFHLPGTHIFFETKGVFDLAARKKMVLVCAQHPQNRYIMVFQRDQPLSSRSKTLYSTWCKNHGIEFMTVADAHILIKEHTK